MYVVDAVVPAHNEETTIGGVLEVLRGSGVLRRILVVDDGSQDDTAAVARQAGADVISLDPNRGKGEAMLEGVRQIGARVPIAFFDADLVGLRVDHVQRLVALSAAGYDMACGLRDYGGMRNAVQGLFPIITGERVVRHWVLEGLPATCWRGYSIETAMNDVVTRGGGRTALMFFDGVGIRTKLDKKGWWVGLLGQLKMFGEIARTSKALETSDGLTCEL